MKLTAAAQRLLDDFAETYVAQGFPNHKTWYRHKGNSGRTYDELVAHNLITLHGTRGSGWKLTDQGQRWVMTHQESDQIRWARKVFSKFQDEYANHAGKGGQWWFRRMDEEDAKPLGLELDQVNVGLGVLRHKGLVQADATGLQHLELTELGMEVCLHPETLRDILGPGKSAPVVDARTSNVFHGPAQIGDGNVQNVTYSVVLQQLLQQIEKDPNIEPEKKSRWGETLKDIVASGLGNAVVTGIQTLLG